MQKRIFLTGASGFIGGRLVAKLLKRGYEVTCLVRQPEKAQALEAIGARPVMGDIQDKGSMKEAMQGAEAVFHLAGWYAIGTDDANQMQTMNVDGAQNVLELASELGVPKILHTSTVGVFGNTHGKLVDESYRAPKESMTSLYELTKWSAHYEVAEALQKRGAPVIIVQPGGVTGAGDAAPHVMAFQMFAQRTPVMLGARSGLTLAHVEDIAEGHAMAFERGKTGETYILAGEAMTYKQIFQTCEKVTGIPGKRVWAPAWVARVAGKALGWLERLGVRGPYSSEAVIALDDYTYWATADKARRELGWTRRPTEETLRETLMYLLENSRSQ